ARGIRSARPRTRRGRRRDGRSPARPSPQNGRRRRSRSRTPRPNSTIAGVTASALARLIRENQPCVVLTGAGVSTESGIPDFRSPTGLRAEFDPLEYASMAAFRSDPRKVWRFYKPRIAMLAEAEPNAAHRALATLERA